MKSVRFMLLEKLADEERDEPDFRPKYKKVLPPGLGERQSTSIGVGQSLTHQPVYPDQNDIMSTDPSSIRLAGRGRIKTDFKKLLTKVRALLRWARKFC